MYFQASETEPPLEKETTSELVKVKEEPIDVDEAISEKEKAAVSKPPSENQPEPVSQSDDCVLMEYRSSGVRGGGEANDADSEDSSSSSDDSSDESSDDKAADAKINKYSQPLISQTLISQSIPDIKEYSLDTVHTFCLHLNSCCIKLLLSQSKFSGTRKFTLRYQ